MVGKRNKSRRLKQQQAQRPILLNQFYSLPRKGTLAEMEEYCPGSIDRFLGTIENQQSIDREIDVKRIANDSREITNCRIWIIFNAMLWLSGLGVIFVLLWYGKVNEAIGIAVSSLVVMLLRKRRVL